MSRFRQLTVLLRVALFAASLGACSGGGGDGATPTQTQPPAPQPGSFVYDSIKNVYWLANGNLAGDPASRAEIAPFMSAANPDSSTPVINPDGTMNFETAINWVGALNSYNGGRGWMGHHDWQLPTNPAVDTTCSSLKTDNFGIQCTGSALGNLYNVVLQFSYPNSVASPLSNSVPPFINLQPGLYWTSDPNNGGETTISFNTGIKGGNTTTYNFFRVLPMYPGILPGSTPASGTGVVEYQSGPAQGLAVYDSIKGHSWVKDANLPATNQFSVTDTVTITSGQSGNTNGNTVTVSVINPDGAVHFSTVDPANTSNGWIVGLNNANFAGIDHLSGTQWVLPAFTDIKDLYTDLGMPKGDTRLESQAPVGSFSNLQPGFYWACVPSSSGDGSCDYTQSAPSSLQWSFDFDDGFEGTDLPSKEFYVMVYYPGP
jgi:hypothetical protein